MRTLGITVVTAKPTKFKNPHANAIVERLHKTMSRVYEWNSKNTTLTTPISTITITTQHKIISRSKYNYDEFRS